MTASIAQFIGKPLASGGTELRSRRTGIRYKIEPHEGQWAAWCPADSRVLLVTDLKASCVWIIEKHDLSISAG